MARQIGTPGGSAERPALFFSGPEEFRRWLEANHETATELWMGMYKKHFPDNGLTWAQAVPEALCYGWIDSQSQRIDEDSVRQRWTPRKSTSVWSTVNIELVAKLTAEGRMKPAGIAAFERRRPERSGIYAYENRTLVLSDEFVAQLAASKKATVFWEASTPSYRKVCVNWVMTAKQEATRRKRMAQLVEDSEHGRLIPSQRYGTEPAWAKRARAAIGLD